MRCEDKETWNGEATCDNTAQCFNTSCRYNLFELYHEGKEITYTCTFDVIEDHPKGLTQRAVADMFGHHRNTIVRIEKRAMENFRIHFEKVCPRPHSNVILKERGKNGKS